MESTNSSEIHEIPAGLGHEDRTVRLGLWIFLSSEVMLFGGFFLCYTVLRLYYPGTFAEASRSMNFIAGSVNTAILLLSSYLVALAEHGLEKGRFRAFRHGLGWGAFLGLVFLGVKAYEYAEKIHHHHIPGSAFHLEEWSHQEQVQQFFFLYFLGTGLHALHVLIGVLWMVILLGWHWLKRPDPSRQLGKMRFTALYWHFVDIVWIFLFPLFYLAG